MKIIVTEKVLLLLASIKDLITVSTNFCWGVGEEQYSATGFLVQ